MLNRHVSWRCSTQTLVGYNVTRVMNIVGVKPFLAAIRV